MKVKELIGVLMRHDPELPVCFWHHKANEYYEIDDDESIYEVWDQFGEKVLSLNESIESIYARLQNYKCPHGYSNSDDCPVCCH